MRGDIGGEGVRLAGAGGPWLKWHMLRRSGDDTPFDPGNLERGLALGAFLEVDLRQLACGRFVCLHDEGLGSETTGSGPVAAARADELGSLRMLDASGEPSLSAPLLLDELVARVRAASRSEPDVPRIQLDLKETRGSLDDGAVRGFAALLEPVAAHFSLSGDDWRAVQQLGRSVAGLLLGYDPTTTLPPDWDFRDAATAQRLCERVEAAAGGCQTIYLHRQHVAALAGAGANVVEMLQTRGFRVDCWTIDAGRSRSAELLRSCLELGVDQITTNTPVAMEALAATL